MPSISNPTRLLHTLEGQGLSLSLEEGRLRVAPSSSLTTDQREAIKGSRDDLITVLLNRQRIIRWADALLSRHGRVSLIMDNYAVIGISNSEDLAFHREYSEMLEEFCEVKVKDTTVETWGEPTQPNIKECAA